ncbi:MAG: hypothetical protein CMK59_02530 [Proteobacteria bacterium]|nr:hypothetical protein [Pseudomonadota bacterium]
MPKIILFLISTACASLWSFYLIHIHNNALLEQLDPGVLCGPEGGCSNVLASEWSSFLGIAVSAPAVPLYLVLFGLGIQTMRQKYPLERLSQIATLTSSIGFIFGMWLLYHMLFSVKELCAYCIIMDILNLSVLISGAFLHPDNPWKSFSIATVQRLFSLKSEAVLIPSILIGTVAITILFPEPEQDVEAATSAALKAIQTEDQNKGAEPVKKTTPKKASKATSSTQKTRRVVLNETGAEIPIDASVPTKGPATAPVTIILFEDFQCPFCSKLAGNIEELLKQRPQDVRVAWYHFPMNKSCNKTGLKKDMHPKACAAAYASICAHEQGQFWEMHDVLFQNSAKLENKDILRYAQKLGIDIQRFKKCMTADSTRSKVEQDAQIGSQNGVTGTPNFFVNGRKLGGAQPIEALVAVVDALKEKSEGQILLDVEVRDEIIETLPETTPTEIELEGPYGNFFIDAFEASVVDGKAQSKAGAEPSQNITWYEAQEACEAAGKRLCTEEEWLTACTGTIAIDKNNDGVFTDNMEGRKYPYGNWQQTSYCASSRKPGGSEPVITGNHPKCTTPEGVFDLEGLTKEWVGVHPWNAGMKGGSMYSGPSARCGYFKYQQSPFDKENTTGFRCCKGPLPSIDTEKHKGGRVGDSLLNWSLPTLDNNSISSEDFKGQPVIQTFWATWCGPCRKELPVLAELYKKYQSEGLQVVAINVDKDPRKVKAFLKQNPLPFPVVLDTNSALQDQFDAPSVPATYWIQKDGVISRKTVGYDERKKNLFNQYVEQLLK